MSQQNQPNHDQEVYNLAAVRIWIHKAAEDAFSQALTTHNPYQVAIAFILFTLAAALHKNKVLSLARACALWVDQDLPELRVMQTDKSRKPNLVVLDQWIEECEHSRAIAQRQRPGGGQPAKQEFDWDLIEDHLGRGE